MNASGDSEARAPRARIPVALLGATGSVGQRFVTLLAEHPWFDLVSLHASERSVGGSYADVVPWAQASPLPGKLGELPVRAVDSVPEVPLVFSALDASVAGEVEAACARRGALVVSNAKSHRLDPDVPLVVPEVNPAHLDLCPPGRGGGILTNPNCSTIGLVLALKPLFAAFGLRRLHVVTLQALSGAGLSGLSEAVIEDNLIPFIAGEEEKLESETLKIFGTLGEGRIEPLALPVSAHCTRVPVSDGHTACVSVELERAASAEELIEAWSSFRALPQELALPTAPVRPTQYLFDEDAPQPRLHRDLERGMAACIGRLRPCPLFGWKFVTLSHNTLRGAAGGALLLAELAVARGHCR